MLPEKAIPMAENAPSSLNSPSPGAGATNYEIKVRTDDLPVGRQLRHAIQDLDGVLLLGAGMQITERFKQLLKNRNIGEVCVHPDDGAAATAIRPVPRRIAMPRIGARTERSTQGNSTGTTIESALLKVENTGTPVRERTVQHGCEAYNKERRKQFSTQFRTASRLVDQMFEQLAGDASPDAGELRSVASNQLAELAADGDSALSLAARICREADLSRRCLQMALLGMSIGIEMSFDFQNVRTIGICGLLHDCGMLKIPKYLRDSGHTMNDSEYAEFKRHPMHSADLVERLPGVPQIVPLVCSQVHERIDGSGYPRGRRGDQIHVFARILHVADAYVDLTSRHRNRPPLRPYAAMKCLLTQSKERTADPDVVRALLHVITLFPVGSYVSLSDGSVAQVLRRNGQSYATPIVQCVIDNTGSRIDTSHGDTIVDLAVSHLHVVRALSTPGHQEVDANAELTNAL
jgi:HD-GYP domain-containing protein (c-di-GMP phosphodiesterase class II)